MQTVVAKDVSECFLQPVQKLALRRVKRFVRNLQEQKAGRLLREKTAVRIQSNVRRFLERRMLRKKRSYCLRIEVLSVKLGSCKNAGSSSRQSRDPSNGRQRNKSAAANICSQVHPPRNPFVRIECDRGNPRILETNTVLGVANSADFSAATKNADSNYTAVLGSTSSSLDGGASNAKRNKDLNQASTLQHQPKELKMSNMVNRAVASAATTTATSTTAATAKNSQLVQQHPGGGASALSAPGLLHSQHYMVCSGVTTINLKCYNQSKKIVVMLDFCPKHDRSYSSSG